jgi:hypothetical protein
VLVRGLVELTKLKKKKSAESSYSSRFRVGEAEKGLSFGVIEIFAAGAVVI